MDIAHLETFSLLDYPGRVSAVVWTVGCNLRCPFCYNAELVLPEVGVSVPRVSVMEVLARLQERAKLLDGAVVTGGEPTLHPDLPVFLRQVKELGLLVKLDTNGTRPDVLRCVLEDGLVDYLALDIKSPFPRYLEFTGLPVPGHVALEVVSDGSSTLGLVPEGRSASEGVPDLVARIRESITLIRDRAPDYEFRTTAAPGLAEDDLLAIAAAIGGSRRYALQPFFVPGGKRLVAETWRDRPALSPGALRALLPKIQKVVPTEVRG